MNPLPHILTLGSLIKEEVVQSLEHNVMQNTLVLESLEPFPGYHGENLPSEPRPGAVYLVTSRSHPVEEIFRISKKLCSYMDFTMDVSPGEAEIYNQQYPVIRVRGMDSYSRIADIQGCFSDGGIHFMKRKRIKAQGLIKIDKIFHLEKMADQIHRDLDDALTYYVEIPFHFNWNLFRKVTFNIKNNVDNSNFDAALGFIYQRNIVDFVRIYTQNPSADRLQAIRLKYLEEIRKIQEL